MGTDAGRRDFWREHIKAWSESGLTQRAYCQEHGLPLLLTFPIALDLDLV